MYPRVASAETPQQGLSTAEMMRGIGFWAGVAAVAVLVCVEFVLRRWIQPSTYHWLLLLGLIVLPLFCLTGTSATVLEQSKTVASCASCHSMDPFINDLHDPKSSTLASRHYRNKWIPTDQCYSCHTTYGIHGTLQAKRDGLRHWWLYVTGNWKRPIHFLGKYPDTTCLECHGGTPGYEHARAHQAVFSSSASERVGCLFCHGPPHPTAEERMKYPGPEGLSAKKKATSDDKGQASNKPQDGTDR